MPLYMKFEGGVPLPEDALPTEPIAQKTGSSIPEFAGRLVLANLEEEAERQRAAAETAAKFDALRNVENLIPTREEVLEIVEEMGLPRPERRKVC